MFCTRCGAQIDDSAKFCSNCGSPVSEIQQKDTFYVRKLPMVMIVILTLGLLITSFVTGAGSMTLAMLISCIQGIVLIILIYRLDKIEPEPVKLLVGLFFMGAIPVVLAAIGLETLLDIPLSMILVPGTTAYAIAEAFIIAAFSEEILKYFALKILTWKHPAFNFRFDGVVYSTTLAIGFEVVENILYVINSTANTAFLRSAFPGHCIFGIYMGYYYGQAKSIELSGDIKGAKKMRRKGLLVAIAIHGFYDAIAMIIDANDSAVLAILGFLLLVVTMCVLNVSAYKNIKKFAHEDKPV